MSIDDPRPHSEKTAHNREESPQRLTEAGITFTEHNHGAHLVVAERWDFWPGTGKFTDRVSKRSGRGVFKLIHIVKRDTK